MTDRRGYRGYIVSRAVRGVHYPQRVQNLVVRDYAQRQKLALKMSVIEYAMPNCTMMLEQVLGELDSLEGVIAFSAFTLPPLRERRAKVFERLFRSGAVFHAALENLVVRDAGGMAELDDLIDVSALLPAVPFGGRYEKSGDGPFPALDAGGRALLAEATPESPPL